MGHCIGSRYVAENGDALKSLPIKGGMLGPFSSNKLIYKIW